MSRSAHIASSSGRRRIDGNILARRQRQQIDQRLAPRPPARRAAGCQTFMLMDDALRGEEQDGRVRAGDEQIGDEILVLQAGAGAALAAAFLCAVGMSSGTRLI